jgi:Methyltransferase domain/Putative zinc binding domain
MTRLTALNACAVCGGDALEPVMDLPDFPLTGLYVHKRDPDYRGIDQGLIICALCGHAQLRHAVDPQTLYADAYTHRSGESPIAAAGNDAFARFLFDMAGDATFRRIVEIGCNDLYLLNKVADRGEALFGIDPIWQDAQPPETTKIHIIGKFIQDVDFATDVGGAPDLVLSAHTLEHIADVADQLARLVTAAADNALFVIEVPDFDSLLRLCRFDQVFHQHVQYFSLASFRRLLQRIGGRYIAHRHNYRYWGGTMLVAFRKDGQNAETGAPPHHPTATLCVERLALFRRQLDEAATLLHGARQGPLYGFGAAQMLPTLAYHMKTDLGFLDALLDDNPARQGLCYPNLAPSIRAPDSVTNIEDATVVLTALDSARPILRRLFTLGAKDIVLPLHVI